MPLISPGVSNTAFPAILEARRWLESYDGRLGPALDLSQAAPPYAPPDELLAQLGEAAGGVATARYGPVPGELALRSTYAEHVSALYGAAISPGSVSITSGANQAFLIATLLVAQKGEAVVLPVPWYFNHKMTLDLLGIECRQLPCGSDFLPDVAQLRDLIDSKVRAVVLVTPNNPTGAIYPPALIDRIAALCRDRNVWLIIDETYRDFLPNNKLRPHELFSTDIRDGLIGIYSFSKSLAIPGHRIGALIHPENVADSTIKIQDCIQICPPRAAQIATTWALKNLAEWRDERRTFMLNQAIAFQRALEPVRGWTITSLGAYFAYLRHPYEEMSADIVAEQLARQNGILLLPGTHFGQGQDRYLRASVAGLTSDAYSELPIRLRM